MYNNQLTGKIPVELGNLSNLQGLSLSWNRLTGEIPAGLGDIDTLQYLALYNNRLSGTIPSTITDRTWKSLNLENPPYVANEIADQVITTNSPFNLTVSSAFADLNNDTITYSITGLPNGLTFDATTKVISGQATTNGTYNVTITGTDNDGNVSDTFIVTVGGNNNATITGTATANVTEDATSPNLTATGSLTVTDVDTGENKFNTTVTPVGTALGSLTITEGGVFNYTVANSAVQYLGQGQTKTETFTVTSFDGTASQDITVTINGVNDAPVLNSALAPQTTRENQAFSFTIPNNTFNDGENDSLTFSLGGNDASLFNINSATRTISFKSAPDFENPLDSDDNNVYDITVIANDGTVNSAPQAVTITVTDRAVFTINDVTVNESAGTANFTVTTLDPIASGTATVNYATANYTAYAEPYDYTATSDLCGRSPTGSSVTINDDSYFEPANETFFVNLRNPSSNATIADAQGVGGRFYSRQRHPNNHQCSKWQCGRRK